jgi:tripartite-type tricarboxylate transporter receptor subunit TctC
MIQSALKIKVTSVPYKGTAPAMNDLLGGQVDLMCEQATNAVPQIEGQKVKTFAQTGLQRLSISALKNVPTLAEAGLPNFNVQVWHGLYAPKPLQTQWFHPLHRCYPQSLSAPRAFEEPQPDLEQFCR